MAKYLYVQIQGVQQPVKIRADSIQLEGHEYMIKLGNQEVGVFKDHCIFGWWFQDEDE